MLNAVRTLATDPAYRRLFFKTGSYDVLVKAGFIPEPVHDPKVTLATDPYAHKKHTLPPGGVVLLMTGCFAPLHYGHIEAMESARFRLTEMGRTVNAGYFSPCHHEYVFSKTRSRLFSQDSRVEEMAKSLRKHAPWLRPSTWELRQRGAMNFTSVYRAFVEHFDDQQVVFVYGADNKNFRLAFLDGALNICVSRTEQYERPQVAKRLKTNTLYLKGGQYKAWSSTMLRDYLVKHD